MSERAGRLVPGPAGPGDARALPRNTRQGAAVKAVLAAAGGFRSAQELHAELRSQGENVGLTTVYRRLAQLADAGAVDAVQSDDGESVYRLCASEGHHHHVVCRSCGASVEVAAPEVEAWASRVAEQAGYSAVSHTVEVFGTCSACAATAALRGRSRS